MGASPPAPTSDLAELSLRSGLALLAALGDEPLMHPIELRLRLDGEPPKSVGGEEVHIAVIPVLDGDDGDDFDPFPTGFFEHLVDEAVRRPIAGGTEVDLAAVGQVTVRREQLQCLSCDLAGLDKFDECAGPDVEAGCVLREAFDVFARGVRDSDRAPSWAAGAFRFQEVSPRSRRSCSLAVSTSARTKPCSASSSSRV